MKPYLKLFFVDSVQYSGDRPEGKNEGVFTVDSLSGKDEHAVRFKRLQLKEGVGLASRSTSVHCCVLPHSYVRFELKRVREKDSMVRKN